MDSEQDGLPESKEELIELLEQYKFKFLQQSVELDDFFNNSPCGYINLDSNGKILKVNITFLDWLDYSKKQILSLNSFIEIVSEKDRPIFEKNFKETILGKNIKNLEVVLLGRNGKQIDVYISGKTASLADETNKIIKLLVFDVSEKKKILGALEEKSRLLQIQNEIMNQDLLLASRIQQAMLPKQNLIKTISTMFLPLEKLGGDFFDFIQLNDQDTLGIFISDVAGHGVASAFITAIIKSTIQQMSNSVKEDPAQFLSTTNDIVIQFSEGKFVTALYCIINYKTKKIKIAHAGHPFPYVISNHTTEILPIKNKRRPLGISTSAFLKESGKQFETEEFDLARYNKILFFTDGLTEASIYSEKNETEYFESRLERVLYENRIKQSEILLKNIFFELLNFLGGASLDDDVCMVGVDL